MIYMVKRSVLIIAGMVAVFAGFYYFAKLSLEINVSRIIGTKVTVGSLSLGVFPAEAGLNDVRIYQPKGFEKGVMAKIPSIKARFGPIPFQEGRLSVAALTIDVPQLVVIKDTKGGLNVNELMLGGYKTYINVNEFVFSAGTVIFIDHTAGTKPSVQGYDVNIYERRYSDLPTAEDIAAKMLADILGRTAIKGAVIYGVATAAGVSLLGPVAIPVGAGMILTGDDSAGDVFQKGHDSVYEAARQALKMMGDITYEDKRSGEVKGTAGGSDVTIRINDQEKNKTEARVTARRMLLPDRRTAEGVLYEISIRLE